MNKQNGTTFSNDLNHIRQSIADILLTQIGTRIARRTYGSLIFEFIDQPINHAILLQLSAATVMAIKLWEPRVQVLKSEMLPQKNKVLLTLTIIEKQSGQQATLKPILLKG